jgi:hypothetical protein
MMIHMIFAAVATIDVQRAGPARPWPARAGPCQPVAGRAGPRAAPGRTTPGYGPRPRPMARSVGHFDGPRASRAGFLPGRATTHCQPDSKKTLAGLYLAGHSPLPQLSRPLLQKKELSRPQPIAKT